MRADAPEDLSCSSLDTGAEMAIHVLILRQVTGHELELRQERVHAPSPVILLWLDETFAFGPIGRTVVLTSALAPRQHSLAEVL